jgi:hypothetical protein
MKSLGKTKKAAIVSTRNQKQKHTIENAKVVWKSKVTLKLCALNCDFKHVNNYQLCSNM